MAMAIVDVENALPTDCLKRACRRPWAEMVGFFA